MKLPGNIVILLIEELIVFILQNMPVDIIILLWLNIVQT